MNRAVLNFGRSPSVKNKTVYLGMETNPSFSSFIFKMGTRAWDEEEGGGI